MFKEELICAALCDLVPFVQFKKREKHPWKSVNFSTKSLNASHIQRMIKCYVFMVFASGVIHVIMDRIYFSLNFVLLGSH